MQKKSYTNREQNIKEARRILQNAKKKGRALSSGEKEGVNRAQMTSLVDAIFAAYK